MIERLAVVEEPRKEWHLQFTIASAGRSGDIVAVASGASVARGTFELGPVDLQLDLGDRVAITGPNGAGKSTLLALLLGRLAPTRSSAGLRSAVVVGEVDQARTAFESGPPWDEPSRRRCRTGRTRRCAPCWPSSASAPTTSPDRPDRCPRERTRAAPRAAPGARGQSPRPRRADQSPGPARHRAVGAGDRRLRRHRAARHPRPADAGVSAPDPPLGGRRGRVREVTPDETRRPGGTHRDPPGHPATTYAARPRLWWQPHRGAGRGRSDPRDR